MRMARATVWAEKGPKDAVNDPRKKIHSSNKKGRFGKLFASGNGSAMASPQQQSSKPSKAKLRLYAAPQHDTLVPRLSASEANESDDFTNFTSSTYVPTTRTSNAPSLARSSLHHSMSQSNSMHNFNESAPPSPVRQHPRRMDSLASSGTDSLHKDAEAAFEASSRRTLSQVQFGLPGSNLTSPRSGSPTQLQQYTTHHVPSDSDDDGIEHEAPRPRLFIANADISDSE